MCCHRGHNGSSGTHLGNRKQTIQVSVTRLEQACTQGRQQITFSVCMSGSKTTTGALSIDNSGSFFYVK